MISASDMAGAFARNVMLLKSQTAGLTQAETLLQPPFQGNCMNWVLGHIVANRNDILELVEQPGALAAEQAERYKRGSEPVIDAGDQVLPLEELLAHLDLAQARLAEALASQGEAGLAREITVGERTSTLGQRVFFLYFHESYHVGQTELLRQLAGKNDKII